jgi:hypothetical protein
MWKKHSRSVGFGALKDGGKGEQRTWWRVGGRAGALVVIWAAGTALLHMGAPQRYTGLAAGQRAPVAVVAQVDFECIDLEETKAARQRAVEACVPIYRLQKATTRAEEQLEKLAAAAESARREWAEGHPAPDGEDAEATAAWERQREEETAKDLESAGAILGMEGATLAGFFPAWKEKEAAAAMQAVVREIREEGIASEAARAAASAGARWEIAEGRAEAGAAGPAGTRVVEASGVAVPEEARARMAKEAARRLSELGAKVKREDALLLLKEAGQANLTFDELATRERRSAAEKASEPVTMQVAAGKTLMGEGEFVTAQTVEEVEAYYRKLATLETHADRVMKRVGDSALMLIVLVICVGWLHSTRPDAYSDRRRRWVLALLAVLSVAMGAAYHRVAVGMQLLPTWVTPFAIPLTFLPMTAALMMEPAGALAVGLWSGIVTGMIFDRSFEVFLMGLGGSVLAVAMVQGARRRSRVMWAGVAVGVLKCLIALALAAMNHHRPETFLWQAAAGMISGVFAAWLTLLCLVPFEWLFRHTTDLSLFGFTDMSHPLLRRLAMDAPGTYHHSLMVATLGQAGAEAIGANGLLTTVLAYYHDIGKLAKPEFFTENQRNGENPHDGLSPAMSTLVLQSHVKEGISLAKRWRLPGPVQAAIGAHHGTTLTSFFYQLAKKQLAEAGMPEDPGLEASFRYEGPKPRTREEALLMMADSVEAASRSMEKPTPGKIAELVERIIRDKMLDGQLDECPLTLDDLRKVKEAFTFTVTHILHGRSPYPREDSNQQPSKGRGDAEGGAEEAGGVAGGGGV